MILGPVLAAQVEVDVTPGSVASSLEAITSMLGQLDQQMGASRMLEHPCTQAMKAVDCDGIECLRAAGKESNVALSEECQRFMSGEAQDATPSSSSFSLTIETEESDDNVLPTATLFSALTPLISDVFGGKVGAFSILEDYYDSYTSYFDYYGSYGTYGSYAEPPESGLTAFSTSGGDMTADVFSSIVQSMEAPLAQVMDIFRAADAMQPQRSAARDFAFAEEDEDEDEDVTSHPCGVETVELCPRAVGSDGLIQCLKANLERLSPRCKCALHQLLGSEVEQTSSRLQAPELNY